MIPRVMSARYAGEYRVWLRFDDGLEGEIDLADVLWGPVFEPLKSVEEFAKLYVEPEWHTLAWRNGADLAPESLHDRLRTALAKSRAAE
jgi:Protein of unknown function (DUF2442)